MPPQGLIYIKEGVDARAEAETVFMASKMTTSKYSSFMLYRGPFFVALSIKRKIRALSFLEALV